MQNPLNSSFVAGAVWCCLLLFSGWSIAVGQTSDQRSGNDDSNTEVIQDSPNGIYLVNRWTTQKDDLIPLLDGEVLIEHDPRQIEPESEDPVLFVTVSPEARVLFENYQTLDPIVQEDGRINLQMTLSEESAEHLEAMSRRYLGRQVATVIGDRVVTLHKVRSIIRNGQIQISRCTDDGCTVILQQLTADRD